MFVSRTGFCGPLKRISEETGWRIDKIYDELRQVWGRRDMTDVAATSSAIAPSHSGNLPPPSDSSSNFGFDSNQLPMPPCSHRGSMSLTSLSLSATRHHFLASGVVAALGHSQHRRIYSAASIGPNTSLVGVATAGSSSPYSSPLSVTMPYHPPMVNLLIHADFNLPGNPYKGHLQAT